MVTRNFRFGSLETRLLFILEQEEKATITTGEIGKKLGISRLHANKLAWQLSRKKRLIRFRKGIYLFAPLKSGPEGMWSEHSFIIASELLKNRPYYIGFWSARNHYHLTEQIPFVTQVVVTHRQRPFKFVGSRFEFIKVKKLGNWREEKIGNHKVKIATIEQLIIDCLSNPKHGGGIEGVSQSLWEGRKEINWDKLRELALKSKDVVRRRLGYMADIWHLPLKLDVKTIGFRWLDPLSSKENIGVSVKWGLWLNISKKELMQWRES